MSKGGYEKVPDDYHNDNNGNDDDDDETTPENPKTSTPGPSEEKIEMKTFGKGKGKGPKSYKAIAETSFIEGDSLSRVITANEKAWKALTEIFS